jgi:hypothetical protein
VKARLLDAVCIHGDSLHISERAPGRALAIVSSPGLQRVPLLDHPKNQLAPVDSTLPPGAIPDGGFGQAGLWL